MYQTNFQHVPLPRLHFLTISKTLVLATFFFLSFGFTFSQPVNAYFEPSEFEAGDEITLIIEYGDIDNPVENITSAHFEIEYDGFEFSEESTPDIDAGGGSWFGGDGSYQGQIYIDHVKHLIIVDLEREEPASGHGYIARGGGLMVDIAEINAKRENHISSIRASSKLNHSPALTIYISSSNNLILDSQGGQNIHLVEILDISGRVLQQQLMTNTKMELSLGHLPRQLLIVRTHSEEGIKHRKILLQP